jgi:hypothetical protein
MKRYIIVLVVLLFQSFGFSQKSDDYHIISLLPNDTESVEDVNFYIADIIDNRVYTDNIGIAQKGVFNKKVLSKFESAFKDELIGYLQTVFPKNEAKVPLVLRINQLLISENTGAFKETGKAIVNLDVLYLKDGEYYFLDSFSSIREKNSMDVTRKHDDRIRAVLKECLMLYNSKPFSDYALRPVSLEKPDTPVVLNETINKGFFRTFLEFYNNESFIDSTITFKKNRHRPDKLFLQDRVHKKALYYAYSDGENVFLNAANYSGEKHFVKTKAFDRYLLFNDAFVHQDKVGAVSMAFGVLGVLASNQRTNVLLDLYSGQYYILNARKIKALTKENYPHLYKMYKKHPNDVEVIGNILEKITNETSIDQVRAIINN